MVIVSVWACRPTVSDTGICLTMKTTVAEQTAGKKKSTLLFLHHSEVRNVTEEHLGVCVRVLTATAKLMFGVCARLLLPKATLLYRKC